MEKKMNLRQKLFEIQKGIVTFAITEESERQRNGKSEYKYTPGWEIVEKVRSLMDKLGVMLDSTLEKSAHQMIDYPVYKEYNNQIIPFSKKEMYVNITRSFTWVDVETGETLGPYMQEGAGANGTDKSYASAESLCERYFLMKFFHFTTREKGDEPDAHDCDQMPGNVNCRSAKDSGRGSGYAPGRQAPAAPPAYGAQQAYGGQQAYAPQATEPVPSPDGPLYDEAVNELMNFSAGTKAHNEALARWMTRLNQAGYLTASPTFAYNLSENAQALREGRPANLK